MSVANSHMLYSGCIQKRKEDCSKVKCCISYDEALLCRMGEPVTLCWRLERSQTGAVPQDSNFIQYDVQASVSSLSPCSMPYMQAVTSSMMCRSMQRQIHTHARCSLGYFGVAVSLNMQGHHVLTVAYHIVTNAAIDPCVSCFCFASIDVADTTGWMSHTSSKFCLSHTKHCCLACPIPNVVVKRPCVWCTCIKVTCRAFPDKLGLQGEGWHPVGVRAGCVGLSAEGGAATIEASWVPTISGLLPVPEIHLRDVSHQEVFDAGSNTEFINILPAT